MGFGSAISFKPTESGKDKFFSEATYLFKVGVENDYKTATLVSSVDELTDYIKNNAGKIYFFTQGATAPIATEIDFSAGWNGEEEISIGVIENYLGVTFGGREYYVVSDFARLGFLRR